MSVSQLDPAVLSDALRVLACGGVVAAPTETFFGLLADASRPGSLDRVFELKAREPRKTIALLLPDEASWESLVDSVPPAARQLAARFWPGPLSIALRSRPGLDPRLLDRGFVAVRWSGEAAANQVTAAFGFPVTATSANLSGEPALASDSEVSKVFDEPIREGRLFVVPGVAKGGAPSTVVRVDGDCAEIVRRGAVPDEAIVRVLGRALRPPT